MMRRMRIAQRPVPDMDGDTIDIVPRAGGLYCFECHREAGTARPSLLHTFLEAFDSFRSATSRRRKPPDVLVWRGEYVNQHGMPLVLVGVACTAPGSTEALFDWLYSNLPGYIDIHTGSLAESNFEPLVRFENGRLILYKEPGVGATALESAPVGGVVERRGWQWEGSAAEDEPPTGPRIQMPVAVPHDLEVWQRNRRKILRLLGSMDKPIGYAALRDAAVSRFGISVFEQSDPRFLRFGCLRASWFNANGCEVTILLNRSLDNHRKYFVLAHELAHYVLHYPFIFYGRMMEEASWEKPEYELVWEHLLRTSIPGLTGTLERQANLLAAAFLIPYNLTAYRQWVMDSIIMTGEPDDVRLMVFNRLQPWFPDAKPSESFWNKPGWKKAAVDLTEAQLAAVPDMNSANAETLFQAVLTAALEKEEHGLALISMEMQRKIFASLETRIFEFLSMANRCSDAASERAALLSLIAKEEPAASEGTPPSSVAGEIGNVTRGSDRELVPPRNWTAPHALFPRRPLMPAVYNAAGDPENDWVDIRNPRGPVGTLDEWLEDGRGLVLYRWLTWQKETLEASRDSQAVIDFILDKAKGQERQPRKRRRKK